MQKYKKIEVLYERSKNIMLKETRTIQEPSLAGVKRIDVLSGDLQMANNVGSTFYNEPNFERPNITHYQQEPVFGNTFGGESVQITKYIKTRNSKMGQNKQNQK